MDWAGRRVLSWRVSNRLTTDFCIEAVQEAIHHYGRPDIFNADQGYQFTSLKFTQLLKSNDIAISMGGNDCWRDNVFVELLWKSVKYGGVGLISLPPIRECPDGLRSVIVSPGIEKMQWKANDLAKPNQATHGNVAL